MNYIEIDKNMIPYVFDMTIKGETYTFQVNYNVAHDFFTIDLYKNDEVMVLGEKLVYGKPLFMSAQYKDIPKTIIIPYDVSENTDRITFENMNEDVLLFMIGDDDEILD